jgi:pimeloyl-ACP methyl ester carboxylesterase
VLVHGYLVSHRCWEAVIEPLAEHFSVVALDLPGCGESEYPLHYPYTMEALARTVAGFLDGLGLSRVCVIGHSMGSAVGLTLAAHYPDRVDRLVAASPMAYPIRFPLKGRLALLPGVGKLLFKKLYSKRDLRGYFRQQVYEDPRLPTDEMMDYLWECFNRPGGRDASYRGLQAMAHLEALAGIPSRVACPVQVVWAEKDRLVPRENAERLVRELPQARLVSIAQSGHAPMEELPQEFCAAVLPFLRG